MITIIYVLANVAYFAVLSPTELLASSAVAVVGFWIFIITSFDFILLQTFGNKLFGVMRWIMPFFVACSTFGAVNGGIFASSRLFFVGARNGHMPNSMALINIKHLTPIPCLILLVIFDLHFLFMISCYHRVFSPSYC